MLLVAIIFMNRAQSVINEYMTDNETYWKSTSTFIPRSSSSYGYIKIGYNMHMEFDIIWNGRTNTNNNIQYQQFFRISSSLDSSDDNNIITYYPSLYLQPQQNSFSISVCNKQFDINQLQLTSSNKYHIIISFNTTQLIISIDDEIFITNSTKNLIDDKYIGNLAKIWFTSNTNNINQIVGNASFMNIDIKSNIFTSDSFIDNPDNNSSNGDAYWVIFILIILVIICLIIFCCYKSKQIRKEMLNEKSDLEKQTNFAITSSNSNHLHQHETLKSGNNNTNLSENEETDIEEPEPIPTPEPNPIPQQKQQSRDDDQRQHLQRPAMYPTDSIRESIRRAMQMATENNYNSYGSKNNKTSKTNITK